MTSSNQSNASEPSSFFDTESTSSTFDPEPLLYAFEQAWQAGVRPQIETLLAQLPGDGPVAESDRRRLLEEMVKIDLEYGWRGPTLPSPQRGRVGWGATTFCRPGR